MSATCLPASLKPTSIASLPGSAPFTEVQLNFDPTTRQSRGHAFVTMATLELAATALRELHGCNVAGRYIAVTEARPPQEPKA